MKAILINKDMFVDDNYEYTDKDIAAKVDLLSKRFPDLIYHDGRIYKFEFSSDGVYYYYLTYCYGLPKEGKENEV
jgi:hypothetical protein